MKNILKLFFLLSITVAFASCEKKVAEVTFEGGTNPVLAGNRTTIPMSFATADEEAIALSWTNPNYMFSTGVNSHDVSYVLEIDLAGQNFQNPDRAVVGFSRVNNYSMTQSQLNDLLLNRLGLPHSVPANIEMRVTSTLVNNSIPLPSNVLSYTVTPYEIPPKVTPPGTAPDYADGELFIVGNATPGGDATGWNNPVPVPSQQFTRVSATFYTIEISLFAGKSYLLLPENGSWSAKFGAIGGNGSNNPIEDDFRAGGGDLISPTVSGLYRIDVDFQRGRFKLTKL